MPPHVNIGGHHIVLLKTVANETHTTIPKRKFKTNKTEQDIDLITAVYVCLWSSYDFSQLPIATNGPQWHIREHMLNRVR